MATVAARLFPALNQLLRGRGSEAGPILLDRRRVYILPTRHGLLFGALLLAMLVGSINYNLSLGYALTFLLGGVLLMGVLHTYRNLLGLVVTDAGAGAAFAGDAASVQLELAAAQPSFAIRVGRRGAAPVQVDITDTQHVRLPVATRRRGRLKPGRFVISTVYPLGLFRAWGYAEFDHHIIVYPRPADTEPDFDAAGQSGNGKRERPRDGGEDFSGLRSWQPGDSPRHVAWKIAARSDVLSTKRFSDVDGGTIVLDWEAYAGLEAEARLSLLARLVIEAEQAGLHYALNLPDARHAADSGMPHRERCLRALALYGLGVDD